MNAPAKKSPATAAQVSEESKDAAATQVSKVPEIGANKYDYLNEIDLYSIEKEVRNLVSTRPGFFAFYLHHACREPCSKQDSG